MEYFLGPIKKAIPKTALNTVRPIYHWLLAALAALVYSWPSRHLIVIGVTGTNGKTTVTHLLHEILALTGKNVGSISSLRFRIGEREEKSLLKMTMPGRFRLQKFLAECVEAGCRYAPTAALKATARPSLSFFAACPSMDLRF
ncbi:MAG: hypothetical protein HYT42_01115 [Candidatus Sungbacteria bacterium]|nr:hypothetical protein [Candidatus Sungbacteria bacterium]